MKQFGMYKVRSLVQCSASVILTYGCWSLSASLGGVTQDVSILITDDDFRVYLQDRSEQRVSEPATKRRTKEIYRLMIRLPVLSQPPV